MIQLNLLKQTYINKIIPFKTSNFLINYLKVDLDVKIRL